MTHFFNINPKAFADIKDGSKKSELRLNYEKYTDLKVGDSIEFKNQADPHKTLETRITYLKSYPSFEALYEGVRGDYPTWEREPFVRSMYQYYSHEQERRYGALEIGIQLIQKHYTKNES